MPKYPEIYVTLEGESGNAFSILGRVAKALRRGGVSEEEQSKFHTEATSGDYDHLLQTVLAWVSEEYPDYSDDDEEEDWDDEDWYDDGEDEDDDE